MAAKSENHSDMNSDNHMPIYFDIQEYVVIIALTW